MGWGLKPLRALQRAQSRAVSSVTAWAPGQGQAQVTASTKNSPLLFYLYYPQNKAKLRGLQVEASSMLCKTAKQGLRRHEVPLWLREMAAMQEAVGSRAQAPPHPPQRSKLPHSAPKPSKH